MAVAVAAGRLPEAMRLATAAVGERQDKGCCSDVH